MNNKFFIFFLFLINNFIYSDDKLLIIGRDNDLIIYDSVGQVKTILSNIKVKKILPTSYGIFFLTDNNILFSSNLIDFVSISPFVKSNFIEIYYNNKFFFTNFGNEFKDLKSDPLNESNLVTFNSRGIYYSINKGMDWQYIKMPYNLNDFKSICIFSNPKINILIGHTCEGIVLITVNNKKNYRFNYINNGLEKYGKFYEEVSDIQSFIVDNKLEIFAANNFFPKIYKYNHNSNKWNIIFKLDNFDLVESLFYKDQNIYFVSKDSIYYIKFNNNNFNDNCISSIFLKDEKLDKLLNIFTNNYILNCFCLIDKKNIEYNFSKLNLIFPYQFDRYKLEALNKRGIYILPSNVNNKNKFNKIINLITNIGLNSFVIDMKDDWGFIKFYPTNDYIKKIAKVRNPINIESFVNIAKSNNIYLVARIVVFKDKVLYNYSNNCFAIKNKDGKPWRGIIKKNNQFVESKEFWVDPLDKKVWEYNIKIAQELIERGFNEIQFDYIRFPTDANNLIEININKKYFIRKDDILISFLKFARENIKAPISIDIYGANGWFRTGSRTGQNVEILKNYVDVICPMFYPSHFDENFMLYPPEEERTFRIYYYGTLRNFYLAEKKVVIRPYIQAFNLKTIYDRKYYNYNYILNEVKGVENSLNFGYTFWNIDNKYNILLEVFKNK